MPNSTTNSQTLNKQTVDSQQTDLDYRNSTRKTFVIWVGLVSLTLLGYWIGMEGMSGNLALGLLLGAALIKGQFVITYFMEMVNAPLKWAIIPTVWLLLVLAIIALMY